MRSMRSLVGVGVAEKEYRLMGYLKRALEEAAQNLVANAQIMNRAEAEEIANKLVGEYPHVTGRLHDTLSYEAYHEEGYVGTIIDSTATVIDDEVKLLPVTSEAKQ
jgi:hypothetical protein